MVTLEVPTLVVWGANDQLASAGIARDLVERMSDAKLTLIEDAGHIPHLDQPGLVAAEVHWFLRQPAS